MKYSFRSSLCSIAACAALALPAAVHAQSAAADRILAAMQSSTATFEAGELLLQFRPEASADARRALIDALGAQSVRTLRTAADRSGNKPDLRVVRLAATADVKGTVRNLLADSRVAFAEPNWHARLLRDRVDPLYADGSLWGMYGDASPLQQNEFGSQAGEAWAQGKRCNKNIVVALVDTGVMITHEDLAKNIWTNPFDPVNGIDDDGNGYIDDVNGWDFRNGDARIFDNTEDNHGTHVSGTMAARGLNYRGVAGVCQRAQIINGKAFGTIFGIGRTGDIIEAIDYLTDLRTRHGIEIVASNHSWGSSVYTQAMFDAMERHTDAGILVVAAAGNSAQDNDQFGNYPSNFELDNLIAVAGLEKTGRMYSGSSYGATTVDIGAPAVDVFSTLPGAKVGGVYQSGYGAFTGTSMATPHVTGAALLFKSLHPGATAAQIKAGILGAAVATPSLDGKVLTNGRLDVSRF